MSLVIMVLYELLNNWELLSVILMKTTTSMCYARFICATMAHLSYVDEVISGLITMKYTLNHHYKF